MLLWILWFTVKFLWHLYKLMIRHVRSVIHDWADLAGVLDTGIGVTRARDKRLENILIVLWKYDPDITLYLNANCSKWWQPQVKTERGPEIPSTTQPAPLRTTEPALVIPDSCPSVSVFEILAIGTCFHIKLRSERSFNDDTHSVAVLIICWQISVFANFCPSYCQLKNAWGRRDTGTYLRPETL